MTEVRRKGIIALLTSRSEPITGANLADEFKVSRQVIVQDITVLRASGYKIVATPRGYYLEKDDSEKLIKTFTSIHDGLDRMYEELELIIDYGATVVNVIVEHPVYGEIICPLAISTKEHLKEFMENVKNNEAMPLSTLTGGMHLHTIEVESERMYEAIMKELRERDFVVE